jgi:hypothetical protein
MTREKLVEMFSDAKYWHQIPKLADDVLTAIKAEQKGESILGTFTGGMELDVLLKQSGSNLKPVKIATLAGVPGEIIFRPMEGK